MIEDLFHGTSYPNAQEIENHGFRLDIAPFESVENYLGDGIYFYHGELAHRNAEVRANRVGSNVGAAVIRAKAEGEILDGSDEDEAGSFLDAAMMFGKSPKAITQGLFEATGANILVLPNESYERVSSPEHSRFSVVLVLDPNCITGVEIFCRAKCLV